MTGKQHYKTIASENMIPLFSQPWWLDVVVGPENWDVALSEKDGAILAAMPYTCSKLGPFPVYKMPMLTPWLHIWFNVPPGAKYNTQLAFEKEHLGVMLDHLPVRRRFFQKYSYDFQNWLPFFWRGYKQTTRYSYVLDDLSDLEQVHQGLKKNTRYEIRKAGKSLSVRKSIDLEQFYRLNVKSFERQGEKAPYSLDFISRLDAACASRNCRRILFAVDENDVSHAVIYIVWDNKSVYYLMSGADPDKRSSGATSLLLWNAIEFAAEQHKVFDFEGSMIEPIERFFRSFGAVQKPYFAIYRNRFPFNLLELKA